MISQLPHLDKKIQFYIFHKSTHTDITIHNMSSHPLRHKLVTYHFRIHRLVNIPLFKEVSYLMVLQYRTFKNKTNCLQKWFLGEKNLDSC